MSKAGLRETTQTRQGAEEDRRQSKEKPMLSSTGVGTPRKRGGACRMLSISFRIFRGGAKYVRAQGGRPRREREEIVRAPRGKLLPEAGDRPAPGREAPAPYPTEGAGIRAAASGSDGASQRLPCKSARISIPARDARGIPEKASRYSPRQCRPNKNPNCNSMTSRTA